MRGNGNAKRRREPARADDEASLDGRPDTPHEDPPGAVASRRYPAQQVTDAAETPERGLPIAEFEQLSVGEATRYLDRLSHLELRSIEQHERNNKNRKTLLAQIARRIRH